MEKKRNGLAPLTTYDAVIIFVLILLLLGCFDETIVLGNVGVVASTTASVPTQKADGAVCRAASTTKPPFVEPQTLVGGTWASDESSLLPIASASADGTTKMKVKEVYGCCVIENDEKELCSSSSMNDNHLKPAIIGKMPQFTTEDTMEVLQHAKNAWDGGMGTWPQMSLNERINIIERFLDELSNKRSDIIQTLMWEIGKNIPDAESEFDRTIKFVRQLISTIKENKEFHSNEWTSNTGVTRAIVRRAAVGIILCLGPYNYPLNETYATLIPALLMGNVVILKIPTVGGLSHLLTMEAFFKAGFPSGVINFVGGSGRSTMPPMMKSGFIDGLAFIGGRSAADSLIKDHPTPHRLKIFLQLEAKNMAIYLDDLFTGEEKSIAALDHAIDETILGSLSYNGQRCTALKLIMAPKNHAENVAKMIASRVNQIRVGLPWQTFVVESENGSSSAKFSQITPLPNESRVKYMKELIDDAVSKGAQIINKDGGAIVGGTKSTLMIPAVMYPVTKDMKLYWEEQFGPIVPVVGYGNLNEIKEYARDGIYAQQCSIFTSGVTAEGSTSTTTLVNSFVNIFGKININSQCGRSPDTLPFSGRRSSAMGVMSVIDALKEFSIPTVLSYKDNDDGISSQVASNLEQSTKFLQSVQ